MCLPKVWVGGTHCPQVEEWWYQPYTGHVPSTFSLTFSSDFLTNIQQTCNVTLVHYLESESRLDSSLPALMLNSTTVVSRCIQRRSEKHQNQQQQGAGASRWTPLGELTVFPQALILYLVGRRPATPPPPWTLQAFRLCLQILRQSYNFVLYWSSELFCWTFALWFVYF